MITGETAVLGELAAKVLMSAAPAIRGLRIEPGLSPRELEAVERRFGFEFANDHRSFLATALPVGERWPDWRCRDEPALRRQLSWPVRGVLFDVEHAQFWREDWGRRPAATADAVAEARARLAFAPRLVPVYGHRYLPAGRGTAGHPVLSVYRTDVVYYGMDLLDHLHQEFRTRTGIDRDDPRWRPCATVPFWRDFL
jgi:hypothetical protein